MKWYELTSNLSELARAIQEEIDTTMDTKMAPIDDYLYFMEKPWKWNEEWKWYTDHNGSMKEFDSYA